MNFLISENAQVVYIIIASLVGLIAIYKFVKEMIVKAFTNSCRSEISVNTEEIKIFMKNIEKEKEEIKQSILVLQHRQQSLQDTLETEIENTRIVSQKIDNIYQILINSRNK